MFQIKTMKTFAKIILKLFRCPFHRMLIPFYFVSFAFFWDSVQSQRRVEETKSSIRFEPEKCTTEAVAWRWEHVGYSEVLGRFLVGLGTLWGLAGYMEVLGRSLACHRQVPCGS